MYMSIGRMFVVIFNYYLTTLPAINKTEKETIIGLGMLIEPGITSMVIFKVGFNPENFLTYTFCCAITSSSGSFEIDIIPSK